MRLTKEDAAKQRARIVEAAHQAFMENGYTATTLEDVAHRAGISRSPLYYYFRNKKVLFRTVVAHHQEEMKVRFRQIFSQDKSFFEIIREDLLLGLETARHSYLNKDAEHLAAGLGPEVNRTFVEQVFAIKKEAAERAIRCGQLRAGTDAESFVKKIFVAYFGIAGCLEVGLLTDADLTGWISDIVQEMERNYSAGT